MIDTIDGMRKDVAEVHDISLGDASHHAKGTFFADATAEAIYVPCGHFTVPSLPTLEAETGVPVITSTAAMVWAGLQMGHVRDASLARNGRLFETRLPYSTRGTRRRGRGVECSRSLRVDVLDLPLPPSCRISACARPWSEAVMR